MTLGNILRAETVVLQRIGVCIPHDNLKGQHLMSRPDRSRDRPAVDDVIDQNVRLLYDGLIAEGLPDRFKELLDLIRHEDDQQEMNRDDDA